MSKSSAVEAKPYTDWERIELDYRAGVKTLRQIADENGITHGAVNKRARRDRWTRDLSAKIKAKADALVSIALVSKTVSRTKRIAEQDIVEANGRQQADVRISHQADIYRARNLTNALLMELEQSTSPETLESLRTLGEMLRKEDDRGQDKRNDVYQAAISLIERSKTMKVLSDSLRMLVDMERTAYNMDAGDKAPPTDPLTVVIANFTPQRAVDTLRALDMIREQRAINAA